MEKKTLQGQTDYFEEFIKAVQYLTGLTTQQDMGREIGKVLVHFFGADVGAFKERGSNGDADESHWTFAQEISNRDVLKAETGEAIAEVLESGFLSERIISTPDLVSVACFPVTQENKVTAVMITGHGIAGPLPKELLDVYMAVAGLVGTTVTRLALKRKMQEHRRQLELQVRERTTEVTKVNDQLRREIIERKQAESDLLNERNQLQHLLDLYRRASARIYDVESFVIEECVRISDSPFCFFGFVNPEETEMRTYLWSKQAMKGCTIDFKPIVFSLPNAGIWAEAIRTRKPLIINDYKQPDPRKKGYPKGHVELHSLLSIPIIKADRVVAVMAVANKKSAYTQADILHLSLFIESMWDLLKRKEAEEHLRNSETRLRNIIDCTSDWIWEVDAQGVYTFCSGRIRQVLGYTPAEVVGRTIFDLMPPEEAERLDEVFAGLVAQEAPIVNLENWNLAKDGRLICFLANGVPIVNQEGQFIGYRGADQDITARKRMEEELHTLNNALEKKVEEKTSQLIKAQNSLVRKGKLSVLGQLAGTVGHELRNPLGVMNNAVYFLNTVLADADDIIKDYLDMIQHEINTSLQIITDLMDFARTKNPQISNVAVETMLKQSIDRCTIPKGIDVSMDIPEGLPLVRADLFQMVQVFQNFITNAVQAMPEGGDLSITAQKSDEPSDPEDSSRKPSGRQMIIQVADTGSGISPENMENLFQPLFTTKAKGIGLGLVVCKNIVEAHGGEIAVESVVGQGTTFSIMMPMVEDM